MHELTARHRRKAGSGPPANALIAWISADPHLRSVAASHRRRTVASLPPHPRAAKAAVAACFALVGGGILAITAIVNDGLVAPLASSPSPVLSQEAGLGRAAAGGPVAGIQPHPVAFPAPTATQSMVANRRAPQPIPVPAVAAPSGHIAADSSPGREAAPAHPVAPHHANTRQPDRPIAPIQLPDAGKQGPAGTLAPMVDADDSAVPTEPGKPAGSDKPDDGGKPIASGTASGDERKGGSGATAGVNQPSSPQISTFSQKPASAHGSISADGPIAHAPIPPAASTADRESAVNQGSPRR